MLSRPLYALSGRYSRNGVANICPFRPSRQIRRLRRCSNPTTQQISGLLYLTLTWIPWAAPVSTPTRLAANRFFHFVTTMSKHTKGGFPNRQLSSAYFLHRDGTQQSPHLTCRLYAALTLEHLHIPSLSSSTMLRRPRILSLSTTLPLFAHRSARPRRRSWRSSPGTGSRRASRRSTCYA
jgi:hypothetical protein